VTGELIYVSPSLSAGGYFNRGDVLLRLDPSNYQVALSSAEAALARAEVDLSQEKALVDQALSDWIDMGNAAEDATELVLRKPQLKEAEANVKSANAALAKAERDLRKTEIRAPYEGMVRSRMSDLGQVVGPGTQLAAIFAIDFVEVRLSLTAEDLQFLDLPRAFRADHESNEGPFVNLSSRFGRMEKSWEGRIVRTEGTIDPKTRVSYAVARVEDPYGIQQEQSDGIPLSIGMFVEASIRGKTYENIYVIPRYALKGNNQVLIINDEDLLNRREVEILRTDSKLAYISAGIEEGDRVCLTALEFVVEGMPVETIEVEDQYSHLSNHKPQYSSL